MMNHKGYLFPLAALALLAACGDSSDPETGTDAGLEEDVEEDTSTPTRDIGTPDVSRPTPDVMQPETTPDVTPPQDVTLPDSGGPAVCGNGVREQGEVCDGTEILAGASCSAIVTGAIGGELGCQANCTFDTTGCYLELCGDSAISGTEECDGALLGETTSCEELGFAPNVPDAAIVCFPPDDASECTYDTSACVAQYCGNDNVESPEICDGDDLNGVSCRSEGFFSGAVTCAETCDGTDTTACVANVCGNGTVEGAEVCDTALFDVTCRDIALPDGGPGEGSGSDGSGSDGSGSDGSGDVGGEVNIGDNPGFYVGGVLGCTDECGVVDTSGCIEFMEDLGDDADFDFIPDADDNCPNDPNPRQLDVNNDGVGNVCDDPVEFSGLGDTEDTGVISVIINFGGAFGGLITIPPTPADLELSDARALVAFDDEGAGEVVEILLTLATADLVIELPSLGGGLPIPIPIELPESVTVPITQGSVASVAGATGVATILDSSFEDYFAGVISSGLGNFQATGRLNGGTANTSDVSGTLADIEIAYGTMFLTFADADFVLGTISIDLGAGGGLPIPIPLSVDGTVTGLNGMVEILLAD
jgi:hypothetical protein